MKNMNILRKTALNMVRTYKNDTGSKSVMGAGLPLR